MKMFVIEHDNPIKKEGLNQLRKNEIIEKWLLEQTLMVILIFCVS